MWAQFAATIRAENGQPAMLVKGGTSLELRQGIAGSRTSKDLDAVTRHGLDELHAKLRHAAVSGWEGFTGTVTPMDTINVPGLTQPPARFVVKLSYHRRPFATVPVEISCTEAGNTDRYEDIPVYGLGQIGLPAVEPVACMTLPWQVAQKLHACSATLTGDARNDRAHDLVDLQIMAAILGDSDLTEVRAACLAVFEARRQQPWPPVIRPLPHWPAIYRQALEGLEHLQLAPTVEDAAAAVSAFVERLDSGDTVTA